MDAASYKSEYASRYVEPWKLLHRHSIATAHTRHHQNDDDDDAAAAGSDTQSHHQDNSEVPRLTLFCAASLSHICAMTDCIFVKMLSQACLRTTKFLLNFGCHLDPSGLEFTA